MLYLKVKKVLDDLLKCDVVLERPKNKTFGHFATPIAFTLAKREKKNPQLLSQEIAEEIRKTFLFENVETLNGYINLRLSREMIIGAIEMMIEGNFVSNLPQQQEKILLEYVSANPTGPLHIGHARGAVFGDVLCRMGRFLGYEIVSEYYVNDAGSQIATLGRSILLIGQEKILKLPVTYPEQYYRGEYILEIAHQAFDQLGQDVFLRNDVLRLAEFGKDLMLKEIKDNLLSIGITFDSYVSEQSLYSRWEEVLDQLQSHNGIYENEGKLWLRSTQYGDEKDRVVVRESGEPTYLAGDIIYHEDKFMRHFDHYINIWGADHHGYIARVKSAIEFLGFDSARLEILLSQMVKLLQDGHPYKMSKRAGNFILMQDVVDEIGADALRFVFLSKSLDVGLEFEVNDLKKQDSSNPIFYIHYANARIHTLLRKSQFSLSEIKDVSLVELPESLLHLAFLASQLPSLVSSAFCERSPVKICDFLRYLASEFHTFYNAHRVLNENNEKEILKVLLAISASFEKGLELLGIGIQREM